MICTTASLSFLLSAQRRHNLRHRLDLLTTVCIASAEQQRLIDISFCGVDQRFRDEYGVSAGLQCSRHRKHRSTFTGP